MKIAVVGQRWNPYQKDSPRGGAERVEDYQLRLLSSVSSNEVHFLTNTDSQDYSESVTSHKIAPSRFFLNGGKLPTWRNSEIVACLKKIQPDVVILHDSDNASLNKYLLATGFPLVNFVHSHIGMAGGLSALVYIQSLWNQARAGHSTVCVSDSSRREWVGFGSKPGAKKFLMGAGLPEGDILSEDGIYTDFFHHPVMWEKKQVVPSEDRFITIGRLAPTKRHHIGFQACTPDQLQLFCPSPHPDDPTQVEIYEKIQKLGGKITLDASDEIVQGELARSKALLCFAQESFGLTAFEANALGVPVILSHRIDDHPVKEACQPGQAHGSIHVIPCERNLDNLKSELLRFRAPSVDQKTQIQQATWDYYNPKASLTRLDNLIQKTLKSRAKFLTDKPALEEEQSVFDMFSV